MNFDEYLKVSKISTSRASEELRLSYETIRSYRVGLRRPDFENANRIKSWSKGKVPLDSWVKQDEA